jgi:hypothetical protein
MGRRNELSLNEHGHQLLVGGEGFMFSHALLFIGVEGKCLNKTFLPLAYVIGHCKLLIRRLLEQKRILTKLQCQ